MAILAAVLVVASFAGLVIDTVHGAIRHQFAANRVSRQVLVWGLFVVLVVMATLLNPRGYRLWTYAI